MSLRILVSHGEGDMAGADRVADVLRAALPGSEVVGSALPESGDAPGASAWLRQALAGADVIAAFVTPGPVVAPEVAFQLGAGWALGKRVALLLDPEGEARALVLTLSQGEPVVLAAGPLVAWLGRLGADLGVEVDLGSSTVDALERLFGAGATRKALASYAPSPPEDQGGDELEDERATIRPDFPAPGVSPGAAPAPVPAPAGVLRVGVPSCVASLAAGRAFSEAVFHRATEPNPAARLDAPFGQFLDALGGDWGALRPLGDPEIWNEVADNVLDGLAPAAAHVRAWYEVGYQLATLFEVIGALPESDGDDRQELQALWSEAWGELQGWAAEVGFDRAIVAALGQMLDNLRGPEAERDYGLMAQVQEIVRSRAEQADAARR